MEQPNTEKATSEKLPDKTDKSGEIPKAELAISTSTEQLPAIDDNSSPSEVPTLVASSEALPPTQSASKTLFPFPTF